MPAQRKYPEELRERAVRMAVSARREPVTRPGALQRVGEQLGTNPETLRGWSNRAGIDAGQRAGTATAPRGGGRGSYSQGGWGRVLGSSMRSVVGTAPFCIFPRGRRLS